MAESCGSCALCCKVMNVPELDAPQGVWCRHCKPGPNACQVYESRPNVCREFACVWLQTQEREQPMPAELKPSSSHVILTQAANGDSMLIAHVDKQYPDAWRTGAMGRFLERYRQRGDLVVVIGDRRIGFVDRKRVDEIRVHLGGK